MTRRRLHQVKEVARMAGVSVRTLHHYDQIGLLVPSGRSDAGYRLYSDDDLLRLQHIAIGRELGLPLEAIRRSLDEPGFDRRRALLDQRRQLEQRARQTDAMLRAIDVALSFLDSRPGSPTFGADTDMERIFAGLDHAQHQAEAERRWGHTDAYRESQRRTKRYTPEDWRRFAAEQAAIYGDGFRALQQGKPAEGEEAMDVAERHRLAIERWFYPCSHGMHRLLAEGYEQDPRFSANIDQFGAGLTPFLSAAIRANAARNGA